MRRLLLAALLLLGAGRADAAILAVCSEDVTCSLVGSVSADTTAGHFNAGYARQGMQAAGNTASLIPATNRIVTNTFPSPSSNFWLSFYYYPSAAVGTNGTFIAFADAGVERLVIKGSASSGPYMLSKRNAAGTLTNLGPATITACAVSSLCRFDVHIVYGVSGSVDTYLNGGLSFSYAGDLTTDGATTLNQVEFSNHTSTLSASFSEIIVADTDTRSMRLITCAPLAAGNTQAWTGVVGNINANSYNDTVFNYTTSSSALSQWTTGCTIPASGTTSIADVRSYGRLAIGATGPQNAKFNLRLGGADYSMGSNIAGLGVSLQNFQYDWGALSPATGAPWLPSDFGAGFNMGVLAQP